MYFTVCIGVSTSSQKHLPPLLLTKTLLKFENYPSSPFSGNPPYILVSCETLSPLKLRFFSESPKY